MVGAGFQVLAIEPRAAPAQVGGSSAAQTARATGNPLHQGNSLSFPKLRNAFSNLAHNLKGGQKPIRVQQALP